MSGLMLSPQGVISDPRSGPAWVKLCKASLSFLPYTLRQKVKIIKLKLMRLVSLSLCLLPAVTLFPVYFCSGGMRWETDNCSLALSGAAALQTKPRRTLFSLQFTVETLAYALYYFLLKQQVRFPPAVRQVLQQLPALPEPAPGPAVR